MHGFRGACNRGRCGRLKVHVAGKCDIQAELTCPAWVHRATRPFMTDGMDPTSFRRVDGSRRSKTGARSKSGFGRFFRTSPAQGLMTLQTDEE